VHVPRRPYREALPGIPTIRIFEALACGIPLVSAPWEDAEGLFTPGRDFLVARSGREMERHLWALMNDAELRCELALHGRRTILAHHTCRHRVDELLAIYKELNPASSDPADASEGAAKRARRTSGARRALPFALGLLSLGACMAGGRRTASSRDPDAGAQGDDPQEDAMLSPSTNGRTGTRRSRQEGEEVRS
jgi:hypothetical protein